MLRKSLLEIYEGVEGRQEKQVSHLIAGYICGALKSNQYRSDCRKLPPDLASKLLAYKEHMDGSEYILRLWRAILLHLQGAPLKQAAKNCDYNDVLWILDQLNDEDLSTLQKLAALEIINMLPEKDVVDIIKDLESYAWGLAWRKLRFIKDYDCAFEVEDLKCEILCEIVRIVRMYQHLGDKAKIKAYAMRAAHNEMAKIIEWATAKQRARIVSVADTLSSSLPQYQSTTLSLDRTANDDEGAALHSIIPDTIAWSEEDHQCRDFFKHLVKEVAPRTRRFIQIVCADDMDEEFEQWLKTRYGIDPNKAAEYDSQRLGKLAAEFLKLDFDEVREVVALGINQIESVAC